MYIKYYQICLHHDLFQHSALVAHRYSFSVSVQASGSKNKSCPLFLCCTWKPLWGGIDIPIGCMPIPICYIYIGCWGHCSNCWSPKLETSLAILSATFLIFLGNSWLCPKYDFSHCPRMGLCCQVVNQILHQIVIFFPLSYFDFPHVLLQSQIMIFMSIVFGLV